MNLCNVKYYRKVSNALLNNKKKSKKNKRKQFK